MHIVDPGQAAAEPGTQTTGTPRHDRVAGRGRTLLVGALGAVVGLSAGLSLGIPGGVVTAAEIQPSTGSEAASQAAGDNEVIIGVVERVAPAVVTINVSATVNESQFPGGGNGPQGFVQQGTGSGVIIEADGLILTNHHVVEDADTVNVVLADGRTFEGEVAGIDTYTDLAFVRIEATGLPTAELGDSSAIRIGQLAIAMGDPLGEFPGSVSAGIVSGLDRSVVVSDMTRGGATRLNHLIQTDAAINPGNSGGPLLDGDGKVIGIDTAQAGSAQGIGFAIPIDLAKPIIDQVKAGDEIARPWIGIYYQPVDAQVAEDNDLSVTDGAWIHVSTEGPAQGEGQAPSEGEGEAPAEAPDAIVADSPAAEAGLQAEDIITAIEGQTIDREHPLDLVLLSHAPGDTVTLTVLRDGASQDLEVTLGTRPADAQ
ncbi:MAG: trypsin-like peptidase domain-containing protein [Candidatus Limnocylindrales bacterium]